MSPTFSHEISVPLPPDRAMGLFTPKGEEDWVPGWRPNYVSPPSGETCQDMIFTTGAGHDLTIWTCLAWSPEAGRVRYLRNTPSSRIAFVEVICAADGPARSTVRVSYRFIALTPEGAAYVATITDTSFAADIAEWQVLIEAHLSNMQAA